MSEPGRQARLIELAVTDLGIIDHLSLVLDPAMTALTGETGAGKTMVVGAIDLLLGARADATVVRPGASEAVVEGRFDVAGTELVLTRIVAAEGRSRAYVDGRMVTALALAEITGDLVDLHGQHAHQSLLSARVQRDALDLFGSIDLAPLNQARAEVRRIAAELGELGGDSGARARELDLLRYQSDEIASAGIEDPEEDAHLDQAETVLANATEYRASAALAGELLGTDGGVVDLAGQALAQLDAASPFVEHTARLKGLLAEAADLAAEIRNLGEQIADDPEQLGSLRQRRQLLVELRRKYGTAPLANGELGDGSLGSVIEFGREVQRRLVDLESHDARAEALEKSLAEARAAEAVAAGEVGGRRRHVAPELARAVETHLSSLAMAKARFTIRVGAQDPGDDVTYLLAANPGLPPGPLSKVASGGELARTMLALRRVVSGAPPILVFDEVDAGIGGDAAVAVGRALAALGGRHQVFVVTHLPQVAAFADQQICLTKAVDRDVSVVRADALGADSRVGELARMMGGSGGGSTLREAARELLESATKERGR